MPAWARKGALGVPLTPGRSIAIDPGLMPLGAPLFLSTVHPLSGDGIAAAGDGAGYRWRHPRRAARGPVLGLGADAAEGAGRMRAQGALWLLWPADEMPAGISRPQTN